MKPRRWRSKTKGWEVIWLTIEKEGRKRRKRGRDWQKGKRWKQMTWNEKGVGHTHTTIFICNLGESNRTQRSHRPQELVAHKISPLLKWHSIPTLLINQFTQHFFLSLCLSLSFLNYSLSIFFLCTRWSSNQREKRNKANTASYTYNNINYCFNCYFSLYTCVSIFSHFFSKSLSKSRRERERERVVKLSC